MNVPRPGIDPYEDLAPTLAEDVHGDVLGLLPDAPSDVLDIGAGSGRDAAHLAGLGHRVLAVEPARAFRELGARLHPHPGIEWMDDTLPGLEAVVRTGRSFRFIMLSAVWMHLHKAERRAAVPRLASLLAPGGVLYVLTRHGPSPADRPMHEVDPDETVALATLASLTVSQVIRHADKFGRQGVRWTSLACVAPGPKPMPSRAVEAQVEDGPGPRP